MEKEVRLNNNIDLFYKRTPDTPRVALCVNFSLNSVEKFPGINNIMEQLFMHGTKTRSAEQLAQELDKYAIAFNTDLRWDYFQFKFVCLNEDFSKALEILTDVIKNTTFDDFEKEVAKMQGEITADLDSVRMKAIDNYYRNMFDNHPYGHTNTKILENIPNLKRDDVIAAYNNLLNNSKKVIAFVGDLDFEKVYNELNDALGDLPVSKEKNANLPQASLPESKTVNITIPNVNQAHIVKGWLVPSFGSEEYYAFKLLNIILGASGLSSRLFLELRDKKGLAYVVQSSYEACALGGNFKIYIATEPKNIQVSLDGFKEEIEKIRNIEVSDEELENAKSNLIGKSEFLQETNKHQANVYSHYGIHGVGFDFGDKFKQKIQTVTKEQLLACAKKYFNDISVLSIVKPE